MYILIRIYYKGFDVLMMEMTLCIMVLYNVTTCSLLHSNHVSALIYILKMQRGSTPEMLVPVYCARLRGFILEKKMILDFIRTLARKEYVIFLGDKKFL